MPPITKTIREFPDAEYAFLRVQIGYHYYRPNRVPIYSGPEGRVIMGWKVEPATEPCFHLLAFGETLAKAELMLRKANAVEPTPYIDREACEPENPAQPSA
jgi:hypothetical protein